MSLVACREPDNPNVVAIQTAVTGLENLGTDYIISTVMEMPKDNVCYIESVTGEGVYTEYPLSAEGTYDPVAYEDANATNYYLSDWITPEGKMYITDSRYEQGLSDNLWIEMPDSYAKDTANRKTMYLNWIVPALTEVETFGSIDADLGAGMVNMSLYKAKMPAEMVKKICGVDTLGLYKNMKSDNKDNTAMVSLLNMYIEELDMSLTFSDATVIIGVYEGAVRYIQIQAGGLGSIMYYTKTVVVQSFEHRDLPDFAGATMYIDNVKSLAEYVAKYPTYEEAMAAMNKESVATETTVTATTS